MRLFTMNWQIHNGVVLPLNPPCGQKNGCFNLEGLQLVIYFSIIL